MKRPVRIQRLKSARHDPVARGAPNDGLQIARGILAIESQAIRNIPVDDSYRRATELILDAVHRRGGKVVCSGMGKAGQIALNIATTFSSTGTPAVFLHAAESAHGDLGLLQPNDVLFLISNSGKTNEVLELVRLATRYRPRLKTIVLTGHPDSPLLGFADVILRTGNPPEVCPLGLTPTTSTTAMTVIGDILVVMLMKATGFTRQDYAVRHHGGYLGRRARDLLSR